MQQTFVNLRSGQPTPLQPPVEGYKQSLPRPQQAMLDQLLSCSAIGAPGTVKAAIEDFVARTGADELMITSQIFDHAARLRSYEIVARLFRPEEHTSELQSLMRISYAVFCLKKNTASFTTY